MLLLTPILICSRRWPGLLCLVVRSQRVMAALGVLAFGATLAPGHPLAPAGAGARRGHRVATLPFRRRPQRLDGAAHLGCVAGDLALRRALFPSRSGGGRVTPGRVREFFVLTPLFGAGMFLVVLANNLGVMWAAVEATALSSVLLVALYNRRNSLEAAWKYIILGSLGLALALLGHRLRLCRRLQEQSTTAAQFQLVVSDEVAEPTRSASAQAGLRVCVHRLRHQSRAGPDAHLAARCAQRSAFAHQRHAFGRVAQDRPLRLAAVSHSHHRLPGLGFQPHFLLGFGLFSMFLAAPFILVQRISNGMLAYSSLEHVGLICTGIALNTPVTIFGALLHMGYHALTKPVLFFAAGNIHQTFHSLDFRVIGPGRGESPAGHRLLWAWPPWPPSVCPPSGCS